MQQMRWTQRGANLSHGVRQRCIGSGPTTFSPGFLIRLKSSRFESSNRREPPQLRSRAWLVVLFVVWLTVGCSGPDSTTSEVSRPVKTMVVAAADKLNVRSFPGRVEASRKVDLEFLVPGRIATLPVVEGQQVAKGQIIAQLRQDEFQARLNTAQSQLDRVRPIAYTNAVGYSHESSESGLKGSDLLAKYVGTTFENPSDSSIDWGALREIAGTWIGLRNRLEKPL